MQFSAVYYRYAGGIHQCVCTDIKEGGGFDTQYYPVQVLTIVLYYLGQVVLIILYYLGQVVFIILYYLCQVFTTELFC